LDNPHATKPRVINTDKAPSYSYAISELKEENKIDEQVLHRPIQYLNNILEQDHRFIKWLVKPMMGFFSFKTANWIILGIEAMHMIKKVQIKHYFRDYKNDKVFIESLFGIPA
jgi:IS6 family transposase